MTKPYTINYGRNVIRVTKDGWRIVAKKPLTKPLVVQQTPHGIYIKERK